MELANYGVSGFNSNTHNNSDTSHSEEEIPVRPPRKRKKGFKQRSASEPKLVEENIFTNELCRRLSDANQNDIPGTVSSISYCQGICDDVKLSREVSSPRITASSEAKSMAAVECKTSIFVDSYSNDSLTQRQTTAIKNDDVVKAAYSQEGLESTSGISAADTDELHVSASYVDSKTITIDFPFVSSKYSQEKPNFTCTSAGLLSETKPSSNTGSESEDESFCSLEDEEVVELEEDIAGISITDANFEAIATACGSRQEVDEKERKSMTYRDVHVDCSTPGGECIWGESEQSKDTVLPCIPDRESACEDNLQISTILPEGEIARKDKQLQEDTETVEPDGTLEREIASKDKQLQEDTETVEPDGTLGGEIASKDKQLQEDTESVEPDGTLEGEIASKDKQLQEYTDTIVHGGTLEGESAGASTCKDKYLNEDTDTIQPDSTLEGESDSSDSESSYTSSEGEYDINYAEVFCGVDSTQVSKY